MDLPRTTVGAGEPGTGREPIVACVCWPTDDDARRRLAERGRPRLLLVEPGAPLPDVDDELEDWLPLGAPTEDVLRRIANLEARSGRRP